MKLLLLTTLILSLGVTTSIRWLSLAMSGSVQNNHIKNCTSQLGFVRSQKRICSEFPDLMYAVEKGAKSAINECKYQFKNRRWNCPIVSKKGKLFGKYVKDTRESAFLHALASASVAYSVTKECSKGKLESCGCDISVSSGTPQETSEQKKSRENNVKQVYMWNGCSDNVAYGNSFSRRFVDSLENSRSKRKERAMMNLHNNQAGRQVISSNVQVKCKCHGVSGSCEIKTCWRSAPSIRKIGELLKIKSDQATAVKMKTGINGNQLMPRNNFFKKHTELDLIYLKKSPNICKKPGKGRNYSGTRGRVCIKEGKGSDGCDLLCCGRGYRTRTKISSVRCNCKFQWCCEVKCETCIQRKVISICK